MEIGDLGEWKNVRVYHDGTSVVIEGICKEGRFRKRLTPEEAVEVVAKTLDIMDKVAKVGTAGLIPFRITDAELIDEGEEEGKEGGQ